MYPQLTHPKTSFVYDYKYSIELCVVQAAVSVCAVFLAMLMATVGRRYGLCRDYRIMCGHVILFVVYCISCMCTVMVFNHQVIIFASAPKC